MTRVEDNSINVSTGPFSMAEKNHFPFLCSKKNAKTLVIKRIAIIKAIMAIPNDPVIFQHSNITLLACIDKLK